MVSNTGRRRCRKGVPLALRRSGLHMYKVSWNAQLLRKHDCRMDLKARIRL